MIAFGPVPSRRLGRSLGVNHIPSKTCSYSCCYCQVGPTHQMRASPQSFLPTAQIVEAVMRRVRDCAASREVIDYITFVPNGEPTLDKDLGAHIRALAEVGIPVAVVTNASLLWMPEVRANLGAADLVSVKVDATQGDVWRRLNRPHGHLELGRVLDGIRAFAQEYSGELISETMLVRSFNDNVEDVTGTAEFLADIAPARAYIGVPTRPPASRDATPPSDFAIVRAYEIMKSRLEAVEILPLHETGVFGRSDDPVEGLLAILAVHPMREAAVLARMEGTEADPQRLEALIREGRVSRVEYRGVTFLVRRVVS